MEYLTQLAWTVIFSINQASNQVLSNIKVVELIFFYNSYFGQILGSIENFQILGRGSLNQKFCLGWAETGPTGGELRSDWSSGAAAAGDTHRWPMPQPPLNPAVPFVLIQSSSTLFFSTGPVQSRRSCQCAAARRVGHPSLPFFASRAS